MASDLSPDNFAGTLERLEADVAEGLFTRGAQVCVSVADNVVLSTCLGDDGLGRAVELDTKFRVYCTIKPIAAMAVANLVDQGEIDLDRPLREMLGDRPVLERGVTARQLLNHTAGLHVLSAVTMELVPPDRRRGILDQQRPPPGWHVGQDAGYSEVVAWNLLGQMLEAVTGEVLRVHLRRAVLDPLGMADTWIGMTPADYVANLESIGVNVDLRNFRPYPMLIERGERMCVETNPAHGGYTTARDLIRLYDGLSQAARGVATPGLPSQRTLDEFCTSARSPAYDVILNRECDYGLGFMTDLAGHFFGRRCSPQSFGHSGNLGSSFAFTDPAHQLSVAVVFNGLVDTESAFLRRPALVTAIYNDLAPAVGDPVQQPDTRPSQRWGRRRSKKSIL